MIDKRPQAGRLLIAEIWGAARHHAKWRELTEARLRYTTTTRRWAL